MNSKLASVDAKLADCQREIFRKIARKTLTLAITDGNGHQPIIVVDEKTRVSDVIVQAERTEGFANLFVLLSDSTVIQAQLLPSESAVPGETSDELENPVHRDIEIGMLLNLARGKKRGVHFPVRLPRQSSEIRSAGLLSATS